MSIEDLTFRAVEAGEKALADGFIITDDGALAGVGFGLQLMNVVATMQAEKNRQIMHSIDYASVIQRALLRTSDAELRATLPDAHLEWQPRDVVGGDFYFFERHAGGWFAAIADCTGHGVPGAFMTLIASSALSQALRERGPHDPAALIGAVSRAIKTLLGQDGASSGDATGHAGSNDGMDCAFLCYDAANASLRFAGAKLALHVVAPGEDGVRAIDGARMGVGYVDTPAGYCWHNATLDAPAGSLLFITTDGLLDQIGGARDIAYGKRRMREQLLAQRDAPARDVAAALLQDSAAWQGRQPRRDDLTFFCFRL
jgi:serine phosphatase RsbU (regulator of sigma subunit)